MELRCKCKNNNKNFEQFSYIYIVGSEDDSKRINDIEVRKRK